MHPNKQEQIDTHKYSLNKLDPMKHISKDYLRSAKAAKISSLIPIAIIVVASIIAPHTLTIINTHISITYHFKS